MMQTKADQETKVRDASRWLWVLLALILFSFFIRVHQLDTFSLWFDEASTARNLTLPFKQVMAEAQSLGHGPYYLFLKFFPNLESSEFGLRYPSVLFGVLGIVGTFAVGRKLFGVKTGMVALLFISLSPMHIWYSREARTYAGTFAFSLLATAAFIDLWSKKDESTFRTLALGQTLTFYAHLFAGLITLIWQAFVTMIVLGYRRLPWRLRPWLWSQIIVFFLISPMIGLMVWSSTQKTQVSWILPPARTVAIELAMHLSGVKYLGRQSWWWIIWIVWLVLVIWGLVKMRPAGVDSSESRLMLLSWAILPPVILITLSWVWKPIYLHRYVLFTLPPYILLISSGIIGTRRNALVLLSGIVLLGGQAVGSYEMLNDPLYALPDWRTAQHFLTDVVNDNDLVLFNPWLLKRSFDYYNLKQQTIPESQLDTVGTMQGAEVVTEQVLLEKMEQVEALVAAEHKRLWLIERWSHEASDWLYNHKEWDQLGFYEFEGDLHIYLFLYGESR